MKSLHSFIMSDQEGVSLPSSPLPRDEVTQPPCPQNFPEPQKTTPQMLPLFVESFKNLSLVGTIKIYKDEFSNLHMTSA